MAKPKLLVFDQRNYGDPFISSFDLVYVSEVKDLYKRVKDSDCILFTGGDDVSPRLYGEGLNSTTKPNVLRDKFEMEMAKIAMSLDKMMLGVCRGLQFLHVVAGGKLIQNTSGHRDGYRNFHKITDIFGNELPVNSVHHQMVLPETVPENGCKMVAWSTNPLSRMYDGPNHSPIFTVDEIKLFKEPEICFYPKIKALGVQFHPEEMPKEHVNVVNYCNQLVDFFLFDDTKHKPIYVPNPKSNVIQLHHNKEI